jgi:hypothetical protein
MIFKMPDQILILTTKNLKTYFNKNVTAL